MVRSSWITTTKMCFMLCFCAVTGWPCSPRSLCILRGDIWEEKGWNIAIFLLCVVYCKWVFLQVIAGLSVQWFVLSLEMMASGPRRETQPGSQSLLHLKGDIGWHCKACIPIECVFVFVLRHKTQDMCAQATLAMTSFCTYKSPFFICVTMAKSVMAFCVNPCLITIAGMWMSNTVSIFCTFNTV